jgi:hypothetical protein
LSAQPRSFEDTWRLRLVRRKHVTPARLMTFGQFRGEPIEALPDWYLRWVMKQHWVKDALYEQFLDEADRRWPDEPVAEPAASR